MVQENDRFCNAIQKTRCESDLSGVTKGVNGYCIEHMPIHGTTSNKGKICGITGESIAFRTCHHHPYLPYLPFRRPSHRLEEPCLLALR